MSICVVFPRHVGVGFRVQWICNLYWSFLSRSLGMLARSYAPLYLCAGGEQIDTHTHTHTSGATYPHGGRRGIFRQCCSAGFGCYVNNVVSIVLQLLGMRITRKSYCATGITLA